MSYLDEINTLYIKRNSIEVNDYLKVIRKKYILKMVVVNKNIDK